MAFGIGCAFQVSAVVWTASVDVTVADARTECLAYALGMINGAWPFGDLWLVVAHKAVQPDNRVTRYYGLWKSLARQGLTLPKGDYIAEAIEATEDGLRSFGAVKFEQGDLRIAHAIMTHTQAALLFMPNGSSAGAQQHIVTKGWSRTNTKPPKEIVEAVCAAESGIVVDAYGAFDDPAVRVVAIGRKDVLVQLLRHEPMEIL